MASASGIVVFSDYRKNFGKTIIIDHGNDVNTLYAHNEKLLVVAGSVVSQGQLIAIMGRTGKASGVHLHFEIRIKGIPVNPLIYLP